MKTIGKLRAAFAAIAIIGTAAGCATFNESGAYRFEAVGQPVPSNAGTTLTVRMLNVANGQRVTDAEVFYLHPVYPISPRATPAVQWERTPLKPDGHGDYIFQGSNLHAGDTLRLTARVPGSENLVVGTVETPRPGSAPG